MMLLRTRQNSFTLYVVITVAAVNKQLDIHSVEELFPP